MLEHSSLTITPGTDLTGGGVVSLGSSTTLNLDTTQVPQLATSNTFSGQQTINNNLVVSATGYFGSGYTGGGGLVAQNNGSIQALEINNDASPIGGYTEAQFNENFTATFYTDGFGNTTAIGTKSAAVPLANGSMVKVFSTEVPEVWLEDYGFGQLSSGASTVTIDPGFIQTANMTGYHVFVTPKGDCKGLYVTNETGSAFEVREPGGGQSNIAFDYRIVAHRKGYETVRLPAAPPKPQITPAMVATKVP